MRAALLEAMRPDARRLALGIINTVIERSSQHTKQVAPSRASPALATANGSADKTAATEVGNSAGCYIVASFTSAGQIHCELLQHFAVVGMRPYLQSDSNVCVLQGSVRMPSCKLGHMPFICIKVT